MTLARVIDLIPSKSADERRQMRENARTSLAVGGQRASDATALLEALDAFEAQVRERRMRGPADADTIATVVEAFHQMPMSETDRMLVQVLLDNPDVSSEELTESIGWKDQAWQLHFGKMCERREHLLWPAPFEPKRNAPFYSGILADFDEVTRGFTLKPEVVEAFARLGLHPRRAP
jgi:hypothetical protein